MSAWDDCAGGAPARSTRRPSPAGRFFPWVFVALCLVGAPPSFGQDIGTAFRETKTFSPVRIEPETKTSIGAFTAIANFAFKPSGAGPFPAVVLMHTCGGVDNPHIRQHGKELLDRGFVVLIVDSFGPRGMKNCSGGTLSFQAGVVDAYAALDFLRNKEFVDPRRVYQVGYSWGAVVSTLLASPQSAALVKTENRFSATVSNYSTCTYPPAYRFVLDDIDRPTLMLMGERDQEMAPAACFPLLDTLKQRGLPVHWQVLPGATHGWDKRGQADRGYIYDQRTTDRANDMMIDFITSK